LAAIVAGVLVGPVTAPAGAHPRVAHDHPTTHHRAPVHLVYGHKVG
jgi:hypothetical protein